jgi:hypothetical protein
VVIDLIRPSVEAGGRSVIGKDGASNGSGHGDREDGQGSDASSITEVACEKGSPGAAFFGLKRPNVLARIEENLVHAGRVGLERAVAKAHTR